MPVLKNRPPFFKIIIFLTGFILSLIIFYIDYRVFGSAITFTLVYLLPIVLVCWFSGMWAGTVLSVVCTVEWAILQSHRFIPGNYILFVFDFITKLAIYIFVVYILSRLKISLDIEKKSARCDYLTGAYNRQGLFELLEIEIYDMNRYGRPLAVAYLDIDDFKKTNDRFGHAAGDKLLKSLTAAIQRNLRKSDILARIGGDEFIILLPDTDIFKAGNVFEKIKNVSNKMIRINKWPCSVSIGVGIFKTWNKSPDKMIHAVDKLMFSVKKKSKNDVIYKEFYA